MKIKFKMKNQTFELDAKKASKYSKGLMFCSRDTKSRMFSFNKPVDFKITSLFVFFPFVAVWLNKEGKVIEIKRVEPFTFSIKCKERFSKLVEIPVNKSNKEIIELLVGD